MEICREGNVPCGGMPARGGKGYEAGHKRNSGAKSSVDGTIPVFAPFQKSTEKTHRAPSTVPKFISSEQFTHFG